MKKVFENIDAKEICERLRKVRESLGYKNPLHFAKKFGIKYTTYLNYEKFRVPPSEFLIILKEKYGRQVNTDWILTGDGDPIISKPANPVTKDDPQTIELLEMTRQVVQSNTSYGPSLKANIRSSHQAMEAENRLQDLEERVRQIEDGSVMKPEVSGEGRPYDGPERREGERRQNNDPGVIPGDKDRRSGTDRRVSG